MSRKWIIGLVIAVVVIGGIIFFGRRAAQQAAEAQAPQDGETVTAFIGELSANATASGQVTSQREASLSVSTPAQVNELFVRVGDTVTAGDLLAQLDTSDLALNLANAQEIVALREASLAGLLEPASAAEVASAEASVASAQTQLDELLAGPTDEQIAAYEASLRSSEASLASASANLSTAQNSVKQSQIQAAQAALAAAQLQQQAAQDANEANTNEQTHQALLEANQAVANAQAQLDALLDGPDVSAAQGNVAAASARLQSSEANFALNTSGPTAAQIAASEAQLAQAEATLANLLEGATAEQITIAEAELEQARLSLADAEQALADASITAPFDGVVTAVNFSEGELASGQIIRLVDTSSLEVILEVDEVDIGSLQPGQPATLTLETWPDIEIPSEIQTIAPSAQTPQGSTLVIYEVHLPLGDVNLPVRVGMTANATLVTAEINDVLLVPNKAINVDRTNGTYSVNLIQGEEIEEVPVEIGLRDSQYTIITDGIQEGDELLIGNNIPRQQFGPPQDDGGAAPLAEGIR